MKKIPGLNDSDIKEFVDALETAAKVLEKAISDMPEEAVGLGMDMDLGNENTRVIFKIAASPAKCPCGNHDDEDDGDDYEDIEESDDHNIKCRGVPLSKKQARELVTALTEAIKNH